MTVTSRTNYVLIDSKNSELFAGSGASATSRARPLILDLSSDISALDDRDLDDFRSC